MAYFTGIWLIARGFHNHLFAQPPNKHIITNELIESITNTRERKMLNLGWNEAGYSETCRIDEDNFSIVRSLHKTVGMQRAGGARSTGSESDRRRRRRAARTISLLSTSIFFLLRRNGEMIDDAFPAARAESAVAMWALFIHRQAIANGAIVFDKHVKRFVHLRDRFRRLLDSLAAVKWFFQDRH